MGFNVPMLLNKERLNSQEAGQACKKADSYSYEHKLTFLKQNFLCVNKSLETISEADLSIYA